jgi:predicted PurR-regulated permease PerM
VEIRQSSGDLSRFLRLATLALVIAALRFAQEVLLPIAFAALLAFLLSPLVVRLKRWGLPKAAAIIATVIIAFAVIGGIGWVVTTQAISLVRELPNYEQNIHHKIAALKQPRAPAVMSRIDNMVDHLRRDIKEKPEPHEAAPAPNDEPKAVPVIVKGMEPSPWQVARDLAAPALRPLGFAGIVIVFVVAMLFQREDLRDRVIKLVSAGQLNIATQALDDAASRVSRYLGRLLVVNACYGVPVGIGLAFIGIPNALLWGLLTTLLRFVPFLGVWVAAAFPLALAIAVDPGWTMLLWVVALFTVVEVACNYIAEPIIYGASTGISNLALLVAAVFWTWLWGPTGLVLSTPLTVCLLVLGKYVPGFDFLRALLGSEPVLEPPAQFYQRMLSMESEDMLDLALKYIEEHSLEEFYDEVFVPALLMSEEDRHRGDLPELRQRFIFQASRELIDELDREEQTAAAESVDTSAPIPAPAPLSQPASPIVLGLPARDEADEIVGLMLSHLLRRRGIESAMQALQAPLDQTLLAINRHSVQVLYVSALPPSTVGAARQLCRVIRSRFPALPMVIGVWRHQTTVEDLNQRLRVAKPEEIVGALRDAVSIIDRQLTRAEPRVVPAASAAAAPAPVAAAPAEAG